MNINIIKYSTTLLYCLTALIVTAALIPSSAISDPYKEGYVPTENIIEYFGSNKTDWDPASYSIFPAEIRSDTPTELLMLGPDGFFSRFESMGDGTYSITTEYYMTEFRPTNIREDVIFADVTGDGKSDLIWVQDDKISVFPYGFVRFNSTPRTDAGTQMLKELQTTDTLNEWTPDRRVGKGQFCNPEASKIPTDPFEDIVVFASNYVYIFCANRNPSSDAPILEVLYGSSKIVEGEISWDNPSASRLIGDVNGDGFDDIVTSHNGTFKVWTGNGQGVLFMTFSFENPEVRYAQLGKINSDDSMDIVAYGDDGTYLALARGDKNGSFEEFKRISDDFGSDDKAGGWTDGKYQRVLGDVNDDSRADIVAFGKSKISVGIYDEAKKQLKIHKGLNYFTHDEGWRMKEHSRMLVDLNGKNGLDILGIGPKGIQSAIPFWELTPQQ